MTPNPTSRVPRRLAVLTASVALAGLLAVLATAGPVAADVPVGWSEPDTPSTWSYLWVFVAAPLSLFVLVGLLAWLPGLIGGEKIGSGAEPEEAWFGGSPAAPKELTGVEPGDTGGASGRW